MLSIHSANNLEVIRNVTRTTNDDDIDLDNIFHANNINIGEHDPQLGNAFMALISPTLSNNADLSKTVNNIVTSSQRTGEMSPDQFMKLQEVSSQLSQNVTVASKVVNLGVKFINELTHLQ